MASSRVWLLTELSPLEYSADRSQCWLKATDYRGELVVFSGTVEQSINIFTLQAQQLPLAVMTDSFTALHNQVQISHRAMLGILPLPSSGLQSLLDSGQADAWLARQQG